jgi:hypothetical protein
MPVHKLRLIQASIIGSRSVKALASIAFSHFSNQSQELSDNK